MGSETATGAPTGSLGACDCAGSARENLRTKIRETSEIGVAAANNHSVKRGTRVEPHKPLRRGQPW